MFIIEEPYVSGLMLSTLEKKQYEILETEYANSLNNNRYNLNFVNKKNVIEKNCSNPVFYSNSENSINFVLENFKGSDIANIINICKDKYEFRNRLQSIYPEFYFEEILLEDLEDFDIADIPTPFIIKPTVGFLSLGVHKVDSIDEWENTVKTIKTEVETFSKLFPKEVLSSSGFIIEEVIDGDEYAIDAYYNESGDPVILNIFQHPFVNSTDVSDRAYISSKEIILKNLDRFNEVLQKIGDTLSIKNFPMHIELRVKNNGEIIPIEINPMRFAGWCTTDLAYYAYGINVYEYFANNEKPDWLKILKNKDNDIFYFAMADVPNNINKENILDFCYKDFKQNFSNIMEFREINYKEKPLFAILFGQTQDKDEITDILQLDISKYIKQ